MNKELLAILASDSYKQSHKQQYRKGTEVIYSTWTPRKSRIPNINEVVTFGIQYFIKDYLIDSFNKTFFNRPKEEVISEFKRVMTAYTGEPDTSHWEALHDLGYLPLEINSLPEGTLCPIRVPMFTINNTLPEFYWLTNFVETIMRTEVWKPMTSATIALQYRKIVEKWADKTCDNTDHIPYQCHDFSLRGMAGLDGGMTSGAGHLTSFLGTDTIPAILFLEEYYKAGEDGKQIASSVPASEHSVQEANILSMSSEDIKEGEYLNLKHYLEEVYPTGIFSYVADTYNLWNFLTDTLPRCKKEIMNRDGRMICRPDSGSIADILCGYNTTDKLVSEDEDNPYAKEKNKGVIELLWDVFGGTVNSKGYKVLDPHVGCIYGDSVTLEIADEVCSRLASKGFASSNIVFGVGSYTYNYNTRDTFGFALKATYGVVNGEEVQLYKDPITDDGTKKSQKGMVAVIRGEDGKLTYIDHLDSTTIHDYDNKNLLQPVFVDGKLVKETSLSEIRARIGESIKEDLYGKVTV